MLYQNQNKILEDAVVEVFDQLTTYYKENRYVNEGWKSNSHYKINRKIILPYWIEYSPKSWSYWSTRWETMEKYSDIDKIMCFISGKSYDKIKNPITNELEGGILTIREALENKMKYLNTNKNIDSTPHNEEFESEFFRIKIYKKGTVHLTFKDEWLWNEFNLRACKNKNWIG